MCSTESTLLSEVTQEQKAEKEDVHFLLIPESVYISVSKCGWL